MSTIAFIGLGNMGRPMAVKRFSVLVSEFYNNMSRSIPSLQTTIVHFLVARETTLLLEFRQRHGSWNLLGRVLRCDRLFRLNVGLRLGSVGDKR